MSLFLLRQRTKELYGPIDKTHIIVVLVKGQNSGPHLKPAESESLQLGQESVVCVRI